VAGIFLGAAACLRARERFLGKRRQLDFAVKIASDALAWSGTFKMTPSDRGLVPGKRSLRAAAASVPARGVATGTLAARLKRLQKLKGVFKKASHIKK
jgi:hypothetical protein